MKINGLPLKELSIDDLFDGSTPATYEVPIYQRNFAWEKDEIYALIQDVYDAFKKKANSVYYIGTLVSFNKGDNVYEIIDGQQRLTTLTLIMNALGMTIRNKLTYRARKKATNTLKSLPKRDIDEPDKGIVNGYGFVVDALKEIASEELEQFKSFFRNNVHIIHYQVPRDIDLNHYFEIMNSRGEQLEKYEIVKAKLLSELKDPDDRAKFNRIWECCSNMGVYIQQKYPEPAIFGSYLEYFAISTFESIPKVDSGEKTASSIEELISTSGDNYTDTEPDESRLDSFQPIIDFSNFLLIVLKLTCIIDVPDFSPKDFNLDDKELLIEFGKIAIDEQFVKRFGFNLLKAKYLLDNYLVHHSNEEDRPDNNPWKLQRWQWNGKKTGYLKNLVPDDDKDVQPKLLHLLSMFEVSFTARQRKNYLFYCLLYLFYLPSYGEKIRYLKWYYWFVKDLAEKYFRDVYLAKDKLNEINTPLPGSFDETILKNNKLNVTERAAVDRDTFISIFGDGTSKSHGIPLFVFNYMDYKLWESYANELRGDRAKKESRERIDFFSRLGCSDFELNIFRNFYFSRTRRSLEHYYPQANVNIVEGAPDENQINCFGNYAMIGSEANSSGSNWDPKTKLDHYLDSSKKIPPVSTASIKFMIMMQKCKDNQAVRSTGLEWTYEDIKAHQEKMLEILF